MNVNTCQKCKKDYLRFTYSSNGLCDDCRKHKIFKEPHVKTPEEQILYELLQRVYEFHGGIDFFENKFQGRERTREIVRIRDNHTCQNINCNKVCKKGQRRFDIHHLDGNCGKLSRSYDKVADIDNLITICHKCHMNMDEVREKMSQKESPRPLKDKEYRIKNLERINELQRKRRKMLQNS